MNRWTAVCLALFWLSLHASTIAAEDPPLTLTISMGKLTYQMDEPIVVRVELLNRSDKPITVYSNFILEEWFLKFIIEGPDGSRVKFLGPEYTIRLEYLTMLELNPMS